MINRSFFRALAVAACACVLTLSLNVGCSQKCCGGKANCNTKCAESKCCCGGKGCDKCKKAAGGEAAKPAEAKPAGK